MLDRYAPGWQSRTHTQLALDGLHVAVDVEIGIPTSDYGMVWRSSSGSDVVSEKAYGDATDRAESQALRRAASKFRLGLYLYYEKGAGGPTQRAPTPAASVAAKPTSNAPSVPPTEDGISKADLTTIRNAVAALGWSDPDKARYLARYNVRLFSDFSATVGATVARDLAQQATQQHAPAAPGPGDPLFTDGPIRTWDQTPARPEVTA